MVDRSTTCAWAVPAVPFVIRGVRRSMFQQYAQKLTMAIFDCPQASPACRVGLHRIVQLLWVTEPAFLSRERSRSTARGVPNSAGIHIRSHRRSP